MAGITPEQRAALQEIGFRPAYDEGEVPVSQWKLGPIQLTIPEAGEAVITFHPDGWEEADEQIPISKLAAVAAILGVTPPIVVVKMDELQRLEEWLNCKKAESERESAYWARLRKPKQEYYALGMAFGYHQALQRMTALSRLQQNGGASV